MGLAPRSADRGELNELRNWVEDGVGAGAVGLSTGMIYEPGRYAANDEVVELVRIMAEAGGVYSTHIRNEAGELLVAISEALGVAKAADASLEISHLKASGRDSWGNVDQAIGKLDDARREGVIVHHDAYPYVAGSTYLSAVLHGSDVAASEITGEWGRLRGSDLVVSSCAPRPEYEGKSLSDLAVEWQTSLPKTCQRILAEAGDSTFVVIFAMSEEDVGTVLRHPDTMIGSDGLPGVGRKPHPRLYGTFVRVLARCVRELGLFSIEEAIRRMTSLPAMKFGLVDRGVISTGSFADLVLFDPQTVRDLADYASPLQQPAGIEAVIVNGEIAVRRGFLTGRRHGRVLRRGSTSKVAAATSA
jgi:N-acyl-D-aspartate/D-glutamate deacylase